MQQINTSVLTRRVVITGPHATPAYEAGWAREAVFFVQAEGAHPRLTITAEVSPDGITWVSRPLTTELAANEALAELPITNFGNWLRVHVAGASPKAPARILIHLAAKG